MEMQVLSNKEKFEEFFNDHWKVLDELRDYMMDNETSMRATAMSITITPMTLARVLKKNHRMDFSTWCKIKKFVTSEDK